MILKSSSPIFATDADGTGTVGGFFKFDDNEIYGITNNHVIANANNCNPNDAVYQSVSNENIGSLQYWANLDSNGINYLDIALFKLNDGIDYVWRVPDGVQPPTEFAEPTDGANVYMMLSDGTQQMGQIVLATTDFDIVFTLCGQQFSFTNLIEIRSDDGAPFSVPGQSGSIIFDNNHAIVGVLLGTNGTTTRSYAIPFINNDTQTGICNVFNINIAIPGDVA